MKIISRLLCVSALLALPAAAAPEEFASSTVGVGVVVSDLDRAVAFYTEVIGMVPTGTFRINEEFARKSGLTDGRAARVQVLRLAEGEAATQWKLMSFGDAAKSERSKFIHERTGMRYITILLEDLSPVLQRLRQHDVKLLGETPVPLGEKDHFILVQDPDGTFIELIGPLRDAAGRP